MLKSCSRRRGTTLFLPISGPRLWSAIAGLRKPGSPGSKKKCCTWAVREEIRICSPYTQYSTPYGSLHGYIDPSPWEWLGLDPRGGGGCSLSCLVGGGNAGPTKGAQLRSNGRLYRLVSVGAPWCQRAPLLPSQHVVVLCCTDLHTTGRNTLLPYCMRSVLCTLV